MYLLKLRMINMTTNGEILFERNMFLHHIGLVSYKSHVYIYILQITS